MRDETLDPHARVHNRVDEILHYVWDPIGVAGKTGARDEYDSYVPTLVKMLFEGTECEALAQHLKCVESERMGIDSGDDRRRQAAEALVQNYLWITRTQ